MSAWPEMFVVQARLRELALGREPVEQRLAVTAGPPVAQAGALAEQQPVGQAGAPVFAEQLQAVSQPAAEIFAEQPPAEALQVAGQPPVRVAQAAVAAQEWLVE